MFSFFAVSSSRRFPPTCIGSSSPLSPPLPDPPLTCLSVSLSGTLQLAQSWLSPCHSCSTSLSMSITLRPRQVVRELCRFCLQYTPDFNPLLLCHVSGNCMNPVSNCSISHGCPEPCHSPAGVKQNCTMLLFLHHVDISNAVVSIFFFMEPTALPTVALSLLSPAREQCGFRIHSLSLCPLVQLAVRAPTTMARRPTNNKHITRSISHTPTIHATRVSSLCAHLLSSF